MKTDAQLQADVMAELQREPWIAGSQIKVLVEYGIVTLRGQLASHADRWDAERAVQRVEGVRSLVIELQVTLAASSVQGDGDILLAAERTLRQLTYLPMNGVTVEVQGGWITLSGEVAWEYQRKAAAKAVRYLQGVCGVSDHIAIKPHSRVSTVGTDIEAALRRRIKTDAPKLQVELVGTKVTLTGTVRSWYERELARHSAWGTPGVLSVVDKIIVIR
ncbi:BON domain-containing protein [Chitinimonas naiadis]